LLVNKLSLSFVRDSLHEQVIKAFVRPSGVQALKNPNPLKDVEAFAELAVAVLF